MNTPTQTTMTHETLTRTLDHLRAIQCDVGAHLAVYVANPEDGPERYIDVGIVPMDAEEALRAWGQDRRMHFVSSASTSGRERRGRRLVSALGGVVVEGPLL